MSLLPSSNGSSDPGTREHEQPASHEPLPEALVDGEVDSAVHPGPAASSGQGQGEGSNAHVSRGGVPPPSPNADAPRAGVPSHPVRVPGGRVCPSPSILSLPTPLLARALHRTSRTSRQHRFDPALVCRKWAALAPQWRACVWVPEAAGLCPGELLLTLRSTPHLQALILLPDSTTYELYPRNRAHQTLNSGPWRQAHWRIPCEAGKQFHPAVEGMTVPALLAALEACPRLRVLRAPDLIVLPGHTSLPQLPSQGYDHVPELRSDSVSAADIFARAPHLTELDLHGIQLRGLSLFHPATAPPPGKSAGDHDDGDGSVLSALSRLRVLRCTMQAPSGPGPVALRVLPQLRVLSLQITHSPSFSPEWSISSLPALERLDIRAHGMLTTGDLHFQDLPSLQALSLTFQYGALPHSISTLTTLTALDVDCYDHWDVEVDLSCPWLTKLTALRSLKWAEDFEPPPSVLFELTGLTSLWAHLGMQCRETQFSRLANLEVLRLEGHVQPSVLEDVAQLSSLKELQMGGKDCCLPKLLGSMLQLEHLQLRSTEPVALDPSLELSRLEKLRSVCATGLWGSELPMRCLTRLEELYLTLNRGFHDRTSMPLSLPRDLHLLARVRRVEICRSYVATVEPISALRALEELRVIMCPELKTIPESLGHLPGLKRLQLAALSKVTELPAHFFSSPSFPSLAHLDLSLVLDKWPASLGDLKRLKHLRMEGLSAMRVPLKDLRVPGSVQVLELGGMSLLMGASGDPPGSVSIPDGGWDFPGPLLLLRRLTLQGTEGLTELPRNLGTLQGLGYLRLVGLPHVETLPASFAQLTSLQGIHVKGCPRLKGVPKAAAALPCFLLHPEFLKCLNAS